jgi:hypothetical protein
MAETSIHEHGTMEGGGAYNRYARPQAQGIGSALSLLERAVRDICIDGNDPIVIVDYGSSQGKNSLAPMRRAIRTLRARLDPARSVVVYHVDQPSNDFNSLFKVLDTDPDSYARDEPRVFSCAIGRSFYGNVLPPASVHIGWSSYAIVWLSRIPTLIPGHFFAGCSSGPERAEFARQGAHDWKTFLTLRATELRPGGHLVVVHPNAPNTIEDGKSSGFLDLMDQANIVLGQMVAERSITAEARARMVLGSYPRARPELLEPFDSTGTFGSLVVQHCESLVPEDADWVDYQHNGDKEVLATRRAQFFRSTFMPSLASAIEGIEGIDEERVLREFGSRLENGLRQRMIDRPAPLNLIAEVIVVAKQL